MDQLFPYPKSGNSWLDILEDPLTRKLLGHDASMAEEVPFVQGVHQRFKFYLQDPLKHLSFAKIGYTALEAFLQAHCTGPPLDFDSMPVIVPEQYRKDWPKLKEEMFKSLSVDGIDVYSLITRIELFWLAKCMMDSATLAEEGFNGRRARMRINFWHQKLLTERSDTLQNIIYKDMNVLETQMASRLVYGGAAAQEHMVEFLVERATIKTYYGDEDSAREDLLRAAKLREFEFALTGALGKKTKFQEKDVTQLVVLAKSRDVEPEPYSSRKSSRAEQGSRKSSVAERSVRSMSLRPVTPGSPNSDMAQMFSSMAGAMSPAVSQPQNVLLNDDTLWENIQFGTRPSEGVDPTTEIVTDQSHLPLSLAFLEPGDQPQLFPMDSIILLAIASSITNTQASDGLTREETLPYATRVLEGGSSNWAIYSQALLVRSRIEGYRSRTAERGLLQLQALVDQVISETQGSQPESRVDGNADESNGNPSTFFPKAKDEEVATVAERMRFIHQLQPPFRWELESELAARWTQIGGLKTALDIYERLEMHAEVALCLAATDREAEAVSRLKGLLFLEANKELQDDDEVSMRSPLPAEAPRLLCIVGDIQQEPKYYNLSWTVSNQRYARAQRSLGKFYASKRDFASAVKSYTAALHIARQDLPTWFALGCLHLELEDWQAAVEAFTRVVQLEDRDYQGWSNLAVALLRLPPPVPSPATATSEPSGLETIDETVTSEEDGKILPSQVDPLQHTFEALRALRRAAQLKRDDARIWDNYLTVAASIPPDPERPERSTPWQEITVAMSQVITLRSKKEGESCIDVKILDALVDHVINVWDYPTADQATDNNLQPVQPVSTQPEDLPPSPTNSNPEEQVTEDPSGAHRPSTTAQRLPFLARSVATLLDTQVAPIATASAPIYNILSQFAFWRHRPHESLSLIEKAWRATTNNPNAKASALVNATATLVKAYKLLGPMERERTGGIVEKGWRFKGRSAVKSVIGKVKSMDGEDDGNIKDLEEMLEALKVESTE